MLEQLEGSAGDRKAVALLPTRGRSRAYPISPQTHIVEGLSDLVRTGELEPCEYLMVESEFAAMSACIGASATGARSYTATASQGLLYMAEALYNASGLGLPIVMTLANRAIGAPINIWNDHSDSMSQRDSGWIQLYAETNQEAADLHVQAFRLAEQLSLPVMVCMDGFILTHAYEQVDLPTQEQVDAYLPPFEPRQVLDPADPVTIGAMVGPEAFTEVKYLMHAKQLQALDAIPELAARVRAPLRAPVRRARARLSRRRRRDDRRRARLGARDDRGRRRRAPRAGGQHRRAGDQVLPPLSARGGPRGARRRAAGGRDREGVRGRRRRDRRPERPPRALGARPRSSTTSSPGSAAARSPPARCRRCSPTLLEDRLEPGPLHFLDLKREVVERELERMQGGHRPGPHAENIIRELGVVAARSH